MRTCRCQIADNHWKRETKVGEKNEPRQSERKELWQSNSQHPRMDYFFPFI